MWIQYLDGKNSRESKERETGLQTGLWSARKKCNCHIGHFNGLLFHSAVIGGMNAQRLDGFLAQTRLNLDPDEHIIFIYDGAPAHNNPAIPGPNTELNKLSPYSPFLNIVEQAISSLKAAIKADISRPEIQEQMNNREEARRQGIALGNYRTMQTYLPRCLNNEAAEG
ncbi:PREDICTED: uncharacterized protein LOC107350720 [Acropora digitifera]|uniref:uncharacterized protein LOC107350720 n=1 Tax=Acropora digitifera TaxID=70779 RepID=UPI00077AE417|nr:PREDICTED: uncharacterized protein LOC107350720 [Acropora digitifera]